MAETITGYNHLSEIIADGTLDLDGDSFKIALLDSGHTFDATDTQYSDVSADEIANGAGYTTGGQTLSGVTWVRSGDTTTLDAEDPVWTATGGNIPAADYAVIYDDTHANDLLVAFIDLDGSFATLENGTLTIAINASGLFTLGPAA